MFGETLKFGEHFINSQIALHGFWIEADPDKSALGGIASGKTGTAQLPEPKMGALMKKMGIPSKGNQMINIQEIHALFLSQCTSHIFR